MLLGPVPESTQLTNLAARFMSKLDLLEAFMFFGNINILNSLSIVIALDIYSEVIIMHLIANL